jgi:hypothetical protein
VSFLNRRSEKDTPLRDVGAKSAPKEFLADGVQFTNAHFDCDNGLNFDQGQSGDDDQPSRLC